MITCILCTSRNVTLQNELIVDQINYNWLESFGIDVSSEFKSVSLLALYKCNNCGLHFFFPGMAGSGYLYAQLQGLDWYYMKEKWEYETALNDLKAGDSVLEIGSGFGEFVMKALERKIDIEGIELNSAAVKIAQQKGLPVQQIDLKDISEQRPGSFDAVCSFQVLEHVPNPREFIKTCTQVLKKGGKLIFSVPNSESFIRLSPDNLLNQPPHHLTWWSRQVFEGLHLFFPLSLQSLCFEPLSAYHLDWFAEVQLNRLPQVPIITKLLRRTIYTSIFPIIKHTNAYRLFTGHSIYVCYRKCNEAC